MSVKIPGDAPTALQSLIVNIHRGNVWKTDMAEVAGLPSVGYTQYRRATDLSSVMVPNGATWPNTHFLYALEDAVEIACMFEQCEGWATVAPRREPPDSQKQPRSLRAELSDPMPWLRKKARSWWYSNPENEKTERLLACNRRLARERSLAEKRDG